MSDLDDNLSDKYSDNEIPVDPAKDPPKKVLDPSLNPDENNSLDSGKGSNCEEENDEDKKRKEVRQEFTIEFEKKIAKFIPPKIKFLGDLRKRKVITTKQLEEEYTSGLTIFKNFFLYRATNYFKVLNKNLKLVFSVKLVDDKNEIFNINNINDETLVIVATDKIRIINLNVEKEDAISYEVIQEIKETEFYCISGKLNNGYLLLAGGDRKYYFYELEKKGEKFGKDNKYKLIGNIEKVHNVYDDDFPYFIDLNNGRILSWLNDDHNIKIIEYFPNQKILMSKNGFQLHDAGLICDKYIILMGLHYPQYDSWLMDTETYQIVKHWITPQNDSFVNCFSENVFFYSSTFRIACDELIIKDGDFVRNNLYECYYKEDKKESWEERFDVTTILDEYTFITNNYNNKIMIFHCSK